MHHSRQFFCGFVLFLTFAWGGLAFGQTNRRIGVFGGTFDPPHWGHFSSVSKAIQSHNLDTVYLLPTPSEQIGHKTEVTPTSLRFQMLRKAFGFHPQLMFIDPSRFSSSPLNYEETVQWIKSLTGANNLYHILGSDGLLRHAEYLREKLPQRERFIIVPRSANYKIPLEFRNSSFFFVAPSPDREDSSTRLQYALRNGFLPTSLPRNLVPFLIETGLYGTRKILICERHLSTKTR